MYKAKNSIYKVRTLLDSGAGHSWITNAILNNVNYTRMPSQRLTIGTLAGSVKRKCKMVQVYFHTHTLVPIECFVLDDFIEHVVVYGMKDYLRDETNLTSDMIDSIVDPSDNRVDHANISLGTALVLSNAATALICPRESTRLNLMEHRLFLEPTIFGTALSGEIPLKLRDKSRVVQAMSTTPKLQDSNLEMGAHAELGYQREVLEDEIQFLWDKETLGIFQHEVHDDDLIAVHRLESSMVQHESGQFEVRLPFNGKLPMLETNKGLAIARTYRQLAEMAQNDTYRNLAIKAKIELEMNDYIEKVNTDIVPLGKIHYLPWRGIMKNESATTKLRIVMDASAKTSASAVSLNQCLYQGPNLILNLAKCLIRFMLFRYRCVADIEKAFLRILIAVEDRDVLRFFWPQDPCNPKSRLTEYRWKAVLFGSISSPFILASVLNRLITTSSPTEYTKNALLNGIYVDNLFHSDNSEQKLTHFFSESRGVLEKGKFNLREWGSNSSTVRLQAQESNVLVKDDKLGALGLWWSQSRDILSFKGNFIWNQKHTKRSVLSFANGIFDPLNWLCPLHVQNRLFIRTLWEKKYKWDYSFHMEDGLVQRWSYLRQQAFSAMGLEMDLNIQFNQNTQIHIFADASTQAYGAVLYLVTPISRDCPEGDVRFVKAKGKIVPVKKNPTQDTMPRWELASILIASNLLKFVLEAVPQLTDKDIFLWNDSKAALSWCSQVDIKDTYVLNRVKDIRERCPTTIIRYVPTGENPADVLTRDISAKDLLCSNLWWRGPSWLTSVQTWPETDQAYNLHPPVLPQQNNTVQPDVNNPLRLDLPSLHIFKDHRFNKALRSLAWIVRWKKNKQGTRAYFDDYISAPEIARTKLIAIKLIQKETFEDELKMLQTKGYVNKGRCKNLRLFLDQDGLIRCESRVQFTILKSPSRAPVLFDAENPFTSSYIKNIHVANNCASYNFTVNAAKQEIYAFRLPALVKKIIGECHICMRFRTHPYRYPKQPVLPLQRAMVDVPFSAVGCDFGGPFYVLDGEKTKKTWVCLFSCLMSRAVYLVLVEDLKSTTFLAALMELASRRTLPKMIISDNATTFTHASKMLNYIADQASVKQELATLGVEWKFIPAKASWQGGIYERFIGIMKMELAKMCGNAVFTLQDFRTHLVQVEGIVNSRPLCRNNEQEILTPNHILNGCTSVQGTLLSAPTAEQVIEDVQRARKDLPATFEKIKHRRDQFWQTFQTQYLETLRFTQDRMANNFQRRPKRGDIIIIHSPDPRHKWKLGTIEQLIISADGECRQVIVRTENTVTTRSTAHCYPLELELEDANDEFLAQQQMERAQVHAGPLKELKQKMRKEAKKSNLAKEDLESIMHKLEDENSEAEIVGSRPRRQAAIVAAQMRQQMIEDNAL